MEYEKKTEKFTFGCGTMKAAGLGNAAEAEEVPKGTLTAKKAAKTAASAALTAGAFLLKHRKKKKRK